MAQELGGLHVYAKHFNQMTLGFYLEVRGGYARRVCKEGMQGCPAYAKAALVVVVAVAAVVPRADGVGALRPGPNKGLVVGSPDAGADGDAQPRDAHRAQAVDVDFAGKVARVRYASK